jgi:hypothetical protein
VSEPTRIEVRVDSLDDLLDERDPTPVPGKDLNPYVSEFVVSWAKEIPVRDQLTIRLHVSEEVSPERAVRAEESIRAAFEHEIGLAERRLRALFREGRVSLMVGLLALAVSLVGSQVIAASEGVGVLLREGLIVAGWVAMWKPIQIYLYDWWPIRREIRIYRRLAEAPVDLVTG